MSKCHCEYDHEISSIHPFYKCEECSKREWREKWHQAVIEKQGALFHLICVALRVYDCVEWLNEKLKRIFK
jgi:hypothetical protein